MDIGAETRDSQTLHLARRVYFVVSVFLRLHWKSLWARISGKAYAFIFIEHRLCFKLYFDLKEGVSHNPLNTAHDTLDPGIGFSDFFV